MATFEKLFNLFKSYPWDEFVVVLSILILIGLLLSLTNHKSSGIWLRKITLTITSGVAGILLILSIITVVFCTFFFYAWILHVHDFSSMENYFITLFLMLSLSLLFGTISFFIHLANLASYKTDNLNHKDFIANSPSLDIVKIDSLKGESDLLKRVLQFMEDGISLNYLGYIKYSDPENLRLLIKDKTFESKACATQVYRINESDLYYIEVDTLAAPYGGYYSSNYFLSENQFVFLDNHIVLQTYPNVHFSLSYAVSNKPKKPKEYYRIIKILKAQIRYIDNIQVPAHAEYLSGNYVRINVFLYSFLLEVFGLSQNYITPLNNIAKANYLLFGLYRFLMQGTFISLLISDIVGK